MDQASLFVSPLGPGSEGFHRALKATSVLADGPRLDQNRRPSLQVSAISMDASDSDISAVTREPGIHPLPASNPVS